MVKGGQDFVRAYGQRVYGIPTRQALGSGIAVKYELGNGKAELMRLPKLHSARRGLSRNIRLERSPAYPPPAHRPDGERTHAVGTQTGVTP